MLYFGAYCFVDGGRHPRGLDVVVPVEVLGHAVAEGAGLSDVNDLPRRVLHDIDPGQTRKGRRLFPEESDVR